MEKKVYCKDCEWVGDLINYYFTEQPTAKQLDRIRNDRECNCSRLYCYEEFDTPFEHIKFENCPDINNCNKNNDCKFFERKKK